MDTHLSKSYEHNTDKKDLQSLKHDLNNLLNNVLSAVELLKDKYSIDSQDFRLSKIIEKNALLASEIVQQLNTPHTHKIKTKNNINIRVLLEDIIQLFKDNAHITFSPTDIDLFILGNYTQLKRVFMNLLTNSIEASEQNSIIEIEIQTHQKEDRLEYVCVKLKDNGIGIDESNIRNIFNNGFSTKQGSQKRGIGLAYVNDVVNDHKGIIEVESNYGSGTSFQIFFPNVVIENNYKIYPESKIIIAEDDKFQREVLKDLLKSMKINVFTVNNGIEALDLFISTKPDVLFIDEQMPGMTGIECIKNIRQKDKSSKIVLVTGSNIEEDQISDHETMILNKPYNFDDIKTILDQLL